MDEQNRETGPVSPDKLKSLRVAGVIKDHTLVRPENDKLWVTAMSLIEIIEKPPSIGKPDLKSSETPVIETIEPSPSANKTIQSAATFSQSEMIRFEAQKKSAGLAFVLCWLLGNFGAHRFYLNKPHAVTKLVIMLLSIPLYFLFCVGLIGIFAMSIWTIVDLFYISGWVREHNAALLKKIQSGES
jgi:TM2 domain-containing membrane protein YozV